MYKDSINIQNEGWTQKNLKNAFLRQKRKSVEQSVCSLSDDRAEEESNGLSDVNSMESDRHKRLSSVYNYSQQARRIKKTANQLQIDPKEQTFNSIENPSISEVQSKRILDKKNMDSISDAGSKHVMLQIAKNTGIIGISPENKRNLGYLFEKKSHLISGSNTKKKFDTQYP